MKLRCLIQCPAHRVAVHFYSLVLIQFLECGSCFFVNKQRLTMPVLMVSSFMAPLMLASLITFLLLQSRTVVLARAWCASRMLPTELPSVSISMGLQVLHPTMAWLTMSPILIGPRTDVIVRCAHVYTKKPNLPPFAFLF